MPASMLYQGDLFKKSLAYAKRRNPDEILILSAKHGVVRLDEEIEPYETTLNKMKSSERRHWSKRVIEELSRIADLKCNRFTILAGKRYRDGLIPHLGSVEIPLKGLGIGKQLGWLKERLADE